MVRFQGFFFRPDVKWYEKTWKKIITSYKQKSLCVQNFNLKRKMKVKSKYHTFIWRQKVPSGSLVPALRGSWGLEIQDRSRALQCHPQQEAVCLNFRPSGSLFHEIGFVIVISSDVLSCVFCSASSTLIPAVSSLHLFSCTKENLSLFVVT